MVSDEGRAVPVEAADAAVDVPGPRVVRIDQHPTRAQPGAPENGDAPETPRTVSAMRGFRRRVVDYLATDSGIRQFVDLGSMLPAGHDLRDVARSHAPDARAVYVDAWSTRSAGPVRTMARRDSAVPIVATDSMRPSQLIGRLRESGLVDFAEPVAVLLLETAALRRDSVPPRELAMALHAEMCPGGHLVATLGPEDLPGGAPPEAEFGPFSLLEPGLADLAWWPYPDDEVAAEGTGILAGVACRM